VTRQCLFEKEIRKRLSETGSVKPKALENAGTPSTCCMYTSLFNSIIAAMERGPWRSLPDFVLEFGLYQPWVHEVLRDNLLHPYRYLWSSSTFADDRSLPTEWLLQHAADQFVHNSL
jgi:hypothetical protein